FQNVRNSWISSEKSTIESASDTSNAGKMVPMGKKWGKNPARSTSPRQRPTRRRRVVRTDAGRSSTEKSVHEIITRAGEPPGYRDLLAPYRSIEPSAVDGWLTYYEGRFAETQNPVYAIDALGLALVNGVAIPPWVGQFWVDVAQRFAQLS